VIAQRKKYPKKEKKKRRKTKEQHTQLKNCGNSPAANICSIRPSFIENKVDKVFFIQRNVCTTGEHRIFPITTISQQSHEQQNTSA